MRLMPRQLARFAAQLAGMIPTLHDSIIAHLGMAGQHGPSGAVRLDDGDAQGVWAPHLAVTLRRAIGAGRCPVKPKSGAMLRNGTRIGARKPCPDERVAITQRSPLRCTRLGC